jgi:hypothetical protein
MSAPQDAQAPTRKSEQQQSILSAALVAVKQTGRDRIVTANSTASALRSFAKHAHSLAAALSACTGCVECVCVCVCGRLTSGAQTIINRESFGETDCTCEY